MSPWLWLVFVVVSYFGGRYVGKSKVTRSWRWATAKAQRSLEDQCPGLLAPDVYSAVSGECSGHPRLLVDPTLKTLRSYLVEAFHYSNMKSGYLKMEADMPQQAVDRPGILRVAAYYEGRGNVYRELYGLCGKLSDEPLGCV